MSDLKDITHKVSRVQVMGPVVAGSAIGPLTAFTNGHRFYFADAEIALLADHLTGSDDLAGRTVSIGRTKHGWEEKRGKKSARQLRQRSVDGSTVFRLDEEWLFTAAPDQT